MSDKEPVVLTILIETARMRWLAGGIGMDDSVVPLLASQDDDLAGYRDMEFDEQASFLRHRFCGALQRGCDRLWGLKKKACQFVFIIDQNFPDGPPELTDRIADHLVQWMVSPPAVFYSVDGGTFEDNDLKITLMAGEMPADLTERLTKGLPLLRDEAKQPDNWERVPLPKPKNK